MPERHPGGRTCNSGIIGKTIVGLVTLAAWLVNIGRR